MVTIRLKDYTVEDGVLKVKLPEELANLPPEQLHLLIEVEKSSGIDQAETEQDIPLTSEEKADMLNFSGLTAGEILSSGLVGAGANWHIGDSEEWVQEQRRKRREAGQQEWTDS